MRAGDRKNERGGGQERNKRKKRRIDRRNRMRREARKKKRQERRVERKKQHAITVDITDVSHSAYGCNMDSGSGGLMHVLVASQAAAAAPSCASFPPLFC